MATYSDVMRTNTDTSHKVARNVSAALGEAGIGQRDLEVRTGIPLRTLSRRLTGNSPFNTDELALIADTLGVNVSEFFGGAR